MIRMQDIKNNVKKKQNKEKKDKRTKKEVKENKIKLQSK
jgi:hypothetical protein